MTRWTLIAALLGIWWYFFAMKTPKELHGFCDSRFGKVCKKFRDMVQDDRDGATLAILWKGKVIANLYGGYADREANRAWEENTMAVAYSTTKIWAGLTAAILASRGLLYYDEKVSSFWPEFAKNGKHNTVVGEILDHQAGLITFGREFSLEEAADPKAVSALIEEAVPHWTPGSSRGYHALTYGFLIDEIIRRLDPINRTVAKIYSEEIWKEGIDFQIGSRNMDEHLIARVSNPSIVESIIANDSIPFNDPKIRQLPSISCMGIGTALGFARSIEQVITRKLIADEIWNLVRVPTATEEDIVLATVKSFGHGLTYAQNPVKENEWIIRILGNGLQAVEVDQKEEIITVMLRNGLRAGEDGMQEFEEISRTIFQTTIDA